MRWQVRQRTQDAFRKMRSLRNKIAKRSIAPNYHFSIERSCRLTAAQETRDNEIQAMQATVLVLGAALAMAVHAGLFQIILNFFFLS